MMTIRVLHGDRSMTGSSLRQGDLSLSSINLELITYIDMIKICNDSVSVDKH